MTSVSAKNRRRGATLARAAATRGCGQLPSQPSRRRGWMRAALARPPAWRERTATCRRRTKMGERRLTSFDGGIVGVKSASGGVGDGGLVIHVVEERGHERWASTSLGGGGSELGRASSGCYWSRAGVLLAGLGVYLAVVLVANESGQDKRKRATTKKTLDERKR